MSTTAQKINRPSEEFYATSAMHHWWGGISSVTSYISFALFLTAGLVSTILQMGAQGLYPLIMFGVVTLWAHINAQRCFTAAEHADIKAHLLTRDGK